MARHAPPVKLVAPTAEADGQSPAGQIPPATDWPSNGWALQGSYLISSAHINLVDEPYLTWAAERDVLIPQNFAPLASPIQTFTGYYRNVKEINPNIKLLPYFAWTGARRDNTGNIGWYDYTRDMMADGTRGGGESWWLHDENGNRVQAMFSSAYQRVNQCVQFTPNNSYGRNIAQQMIQEWYDAAIVVNNNGRFIDYINGIYCDVVPPKPQPVYVDQSDPRVNTNQDFDEDGSADGVADETIPANPDNEAGYGGCRMYRRGIVKINDYFNDIWTSAPADFAVWRNGTRDGIDYSSDVLEFSTHPVVNSEFYQQWGGSIMEFSHQSLGLRKNYYAAGEYGVPYNGVNTYFKWAERIRSSSLPASSHPWGNTEYSRAVLMSCFCLPDDTVENWRAVRFMGALCALNGDMLGHIQDNRYPIEPLDEFIFDWGSTINPYRGSDGDRHMMGDLDVTVAVNGTDADWGGMRTPDYTSGNATFYWAEFSNCLVVARTDATGLVGNNHGAGTEASCLLPNPGTGKVWRHLDFTSTYTNPNSGFQTRGQDTALNSGLGVQTGGSYGSVLLFPWHAVWLRRDDA